jgi:transcriptional regulator with XRE-family HTH domain
MQGCPNRASSANGPVAADTAARVVHLAGSPDKLALSFERNTCRMNDRTVGRVVRVLRRRKNLTQRQLADLCGVSQSTVSSLEAGRINGMTLETVRAAFSSLNADASIQIFWREGVIDLLLDERHAELVGQAAKVLRRLGWQVVPEASYSEYGERGSIDLLGWHAQRRALLVVEVKTELVSVEATLRKHDEKVRLGPRIARDRFGWEPAGVAAVVVLPDESTARRRVARHAAVLDEALPARGRAVTRWLKDPVGGFAGIWFLSSMSRDVPERVSVTPSRVPRDRISDSAA